MKQRNVQRRQALRYLAREAHNTFVAACRRDILPPWRRRQRMPSVLEALNEPL